MDSSHPLRPFALPAVSLLGLAALVFGLGEALVTSSSEALVVDVCQEKHFGTAMGTFGTIFDIGHAAGPILASFLIAQIDFLYSVLLMGAMLLAAFPAFVVSVKIKRE